jgi:3'-phosphoadenosine 5'-phosphosulfate sulfotransferase (PAPS reductase)/FAD synthetase
MDDLDKLEAESVYILREAHSRIRPLAMLWSLGKDSNVLIWLARKAFLGRLPFRWRTWTPGWSSRRCTPSATATRRNGAST